MDCNYWSCYVHEDERLLIGGLDALQMETIRNIPQSENYNQFVRIINIFGRMITAMGLLGFKPHTNDASCFGSMIRCELAVEDSTTFMPLYIKTLFHHFLMKQTDVLLNMNYWDRHFIVNYKKFKMDLYGYQRLKQIFMKNEMINFNLFIRLLPNVKMVTVGHFLPGKAKPSIALSPKFSMSIFSCIDYLNSSSKSLSFSRFAIVQPLSPIHEFIEEYQDQFLHKGWKLKRDTFDKAQFGIKGVEMLSIEKVTNQS